MEERPNYYAVIPADVRYDKRLKSIEKLLYGEITTLTHKTGECWASNNYFSNLYDIYPTTISKYLNHLKELGYINLDIKYFENSKQIEKRIISIVQTNNTCCSNEQEGYCSNEQGGIAHTSKENNTSNNNTSNNKKENIKRKFEKFYLEYPKKVKKYDVEKWFIKNNPSDDLFKQIMSALKNFKKTEQWQTKQFIPYPTTWLNQKRWEDEIETKESVLEILERLEQEDEQESNK